MKTITTAAPHSIYVNDTISLTVMVPDRRWWRRLWSAVTLRRPPWRSETRCFKVAEVTGLNMFQVVP